MREVKIYVSDKEVILKDKKGNKYILEYDYTGLGDNWDSVKATPFTWKKEDVRLNKFKDR